MLDIAFITMDVGKLAYDQVTKGTTQTDDWVALGADVVCAVTPFVTGGGAAVRAASKVDDAVKVGRGLVKVAEKSEGKTLQQATREAKVAAGIPKSQQPIMQKNGEQIYQVPKAGGGTELKAVIKQTKDRNHPEPHVEAGKVRIDANGEMKVNKYGAPRLDNQKVKIEYKENK